MTTILRDAALNLAACGFRIFPCRARGKEPLIANNLMRATTDASVISGWWSAGNYNIGIATGAGSNVWVLDIDGDEGEQTLSNLEAAHDKLPVTAEVVTGSGRHFYFRCPTDVEIRNTQARDDLPGIDVRGNGGYVVAPPSVHPNGGTYQWADAGTEYYALAPDWLIDVVTKRQGIAGESKSPDDWRSFFARSFDGSRRASAIAKASGFLLRKHIDPMVALDLVRLFNAARCDPPLADSEIVRCLTAICHREIERREG
jgi:hypothetical protein